MAATTNVLETIPEDKLVDEIRSFKEIDEADIVTAYRDGKGTFTVESTVIVIDQPTAMPGTPISLKGKMSTFGGPDDPGVAPEEGLALFSSDAVAGNPDIFLSAQPPGTTGLARRLNPDAHYIACRWDYPTTPKHYLRGIKVRVTANGKTVEARPVDWGPNASTGRVADLSPGLAEALGLETDDECQVDIAPPQTGVAVGVDIAAIDSVVFLPDMTRSLVVMTTLNNATYWVTDQIGTIEGGQTLMRRVSPEAPEIVLSETAIFPVEPSDLLPAVVAAELNKAVPNERNVARTRADSRPSAGDDINAKIFAKAKAFVGHDTSNVPGTERGNLACAWAVNEVVRLALGKPISSDGRGRNGLGTGALFDVLRARHTLLDAPQPGSIIISPTPPRGSVHGHVGIVGESPSDRDGTQIFSNSSSARQFAQNRTIKSWKARYEAQLHLQVLFFAVNFDNL